MGNVNLCLMLDLVHKTIRPDLPRPALDNFRQFRRLYGFFSNHNEVNFFIFLEADDTVRIFFKNKIN
jgi:hypothetical protein